jgi:hypothetical protein
MYRAKRQPLFNITTYSRPVILFAQRPVEHVRSRGPLDRRRERLFPAIPRAERLGMGLQNRGAERSDLKQDYDMSKRLLTELGLAKQPEAPSR